MSAKSNAKGSSFERLVCRKLTEWITGSQTPEIFWRSATSGAKATQDRKVGRASHMGGDIVAVNGAGRAFLDTFSVECKDRQSYGGLENLIVGKGELLKWWTQCAEDAQKSQRGPLLIYKALRTPIYVAYRLDQSCAPRGRTLIFLCPVYNTSVGISVFEDWLKANPRGKRKLTRVGAKK